jgi:hypothetical protein
MDRDIADFIVMLVFFLGIWGSSTWFATCQIVRDEILKNKKQNLKGPIILIIITSIFLLFPWIEEMQEKKQFILDGMVNLTGIVCCIILWRVAYYHTKMVIKNKSNQS